VELSLFFSADSTDDFISRAEQAKSQGFKTIWTPQIFGIDALTTIAVAGSNVADISFGTAVIPTYPRHPMMLAQQALTVTQTIGERLILGIGPSHQPVVEGMWGLSFDKPVRHVREYLEALIPLLTDKSARAGGDAVVARGDLNLDAPAPKVMVAALGPQLLKVTGRLADGTILWMTGPTTIAEHTVPTITDAAEQAGRPAPAIVAGFPVCVTDGSQAATDEARARAAKEFEIYGLLPSYRAMLDREGYGGPEDLAIIGSAGEVEERIRGMADRGLTTFAASEFGDRDQLAATRELLIAML
jgi:F420-dependent oxidoreductase-like protein